MPAPARFGGLAIAWLLLGLGLAHAGSPVAGVNATHVAVGTTGPLSGLQAEYGARIAAGLRVAFAEANAEGGVQSRNLTLLALDDSYNTTISVANFATLANETLLLAGVYGTDVNAALLPLMQQAGMPSVGPMTGAAVTRAPFHPEFVNVRPSYADEMGVHAVLLVQRLRVHRIACFYQSDSFGLTLLTGITAALDHVGLRFAVTASYATGSMDIGAALEAIAGQPRPVQAVVLASLEAQTVQFLRRFRQDPRTDPDCAFLLTAISATSAFPAKLEPQYWTNLYFTQVMPPLDTPGLALVPQFRRAATLFLPANLTADLISFQAYLTGVLIVQVLRGIPGTISRAAFLDQLYNTRLYPIGGLLVGLYSRNYPGCEKLICGSNVGLRTVFPATLDPATGAMRYNASLGYYSYSATQLSFPVTDVVRPLLFGQLLPTDDPMWRRVAEAIGQELQAAFAALNAAGGVDGRPVELIQQYYAGDAASAAAALGDRYAVLAMVGSVVPRSQALATSTAAQIGTYQTDPPAEYTAYNYSEVQVQASLPLELMALAAFAYRLGLPVHLRAPATPAGRTALQVMAKSLHTLQQRPASSVAYSSATETLEGLSAGAVLAVGSDADVQAWFSALADLPQLRLLVPSPRAVHLMASIGVADYPQATRFHYPSMFGPAAEAAPPGPGVPDAGLYGHLLGAVLTKVLEKSGNASVAYSTTAQVLNAWYSSRYRADEVVLGPYSSAACSAATTDDCECNEGVRQLTVLTAARQPQPLPFTYAVSACRVAYQDFQGDPGGGAPYIAGIVLGIVAGVGLLGLPGWLLAHRRRRDNAAAPKDPAEPFCILFTDIQSSTHLWASIPDVMAAALDVHHSLIRKLIAHHRVYEVKTIGDSFMCATRYPGRAVEFAIALERELFEHDWGTKAIDTTYVMHQEEKQGHSIGTRAGWNGLRVRVGVHYGTGTVHLDAVTKGYDYYGTVVNTAARVEAVCHGGQIGITQAVYDALGGEFPGAVVTDLGEHVLRGLEEPIHIYQLVPAELGMRTFPSLRLERAAVVEVESHPPSEQYASFRLSESRARVVPLPETHSVLGTASPRGSWHVDSAASAHGTVALAVAPCWVVSHKLVRSGRIAVEDLNLRYQTVLRALATLLETQTPRVRDSTLRAYCERLHVRHSGSEGALLEDTLHGIVQRVLPAVLTAFEAISRVPSFGSRQPSSSVVRPESGALDPNSSGSLSLLPLQYVHYLPHEKLRPPDV